MAGEDKTLSGPHCVGLGIYPKSIGNHERVSSHTHMWRSWSDSVWNTERGRSREAGGDGEEGRVKLGKK